MPETGVKYCGIVTGGGVTTVVGISSEDLNETGEILGILFNTSGYWSPSFGVAHGATVWREFAEVGSAAPGIEHPGCRPATFSLWFRSTHEWTASYIRIKTVNNIRK